MYINSRVLAVFTAASGLRDAHRSGRIPPEYSRGPKRSLRRVAVGTVLGLLSTVSNGWFLIVTGPMWLIGGSIAASGQRRVPIESVPTVRWTDVAAFARFPQGILPGVELNALQPVSR